MGRISARMVLRIATLLRARGVDPVPLCAAVGLRVGELEVPSARIAYADSDALLERAMSLLGGAGLGAALARTRDEDTYDTAGLVLVASPTLREGLARAFRFQRLWGDGERFVLGESNGGAVIRFTSPGKARPAHAVLAECALVEVMSAARWLVGAPVSARGVRFVHAPLGAVDELTAIFGFPPKFGADANEIELDATWADCPSPHAAPFFRAIFERHAARSLGELGALRTFADAVRAAVRVDLAREGFGLGSAARKLKMSARTLQRRLQCDGTSFEAIVDDERRLLASALVARGRPATEVAFLVGFADPSALARARKRWIRESQGR